jgi:hypothetical protein
LGHTGDFCFLSDPSLSSSSGVEFTGRKSMKRLLADKWQAQNLKELTYEEILSYHASHEKSCIKKQVGVGSDNLEIVPSDRFWTD